MSLRELTNEAIFGSAYVWRLALRGLSLYKRGLTSCAGHARGHAARPLALRPHFEIDFVDAASFDELTPSRLGRVDEVGSQGPLQRVC